MFPREAMKQYLLHATFMLRKSRRGRAISCGEPSGLESIGQVLGAELDGVLRPDDKPQHVYNHTFARTGLV